MIEKIKSIDDLKIGEYYTVWEPGLDEYLYDFEYMGFNELSNDHVFRFRNVGNKCYFVMVSDEDVLFDVYFEL